MSNKALDYLKKMSEAIVKAPEVTGALRRAETEYETGKAGFEKGTVSKDDFLKLENALREASIASDDNTKALKEGSSFAKKAKAEMDAEGIGGDGGGGGGILGGMGGFLKKGAGIAGVVATAVGTAYGAYKSMEVAAREESVGKERMAYDALLSSRGLAERQLLESTDRTKPEHVLKYAGDILFPGRFRYQGVGGMRNALNVSGRETADIMGLSQAQYERAKGMLALGVVSGATGIVGGIGAGMSGDYGVGALAGMKGAQTAVGAFRDFATESAHNKANQLSGGLAGSWFGRLIFGADAERRSDLNTAAQYNQWQYETVQRAEDVRNREISENPLLVKSIGQRLAMVQARQQSAAMVGPYALSETGFLKMAFPVTGRLNAKFMYDPMSISGKTTDSLSELENQDRIARLQSTLQERQIDVVTTKPKLSQSDIMIAARTGIWSKASAEGISRNAEAEGFERNAEKDLRDAQWDANPINPANAVKNIAFAKDRAGAPNKITDKDPMQLSRLMLTIPEAQVKYAQLQNVLGFGISPSAAQFADFTKMSQAGLGDFNQLLGKVTSLNQVTGGQNNIEQLKSVLGAAISAGFDKSRVAQQFAQTTINIADSLKLSRGDVAGAHLAVASSWASASGKGDERALRVAAAGMQEYNAFASSQTGLIGVMRTYGMLGAGASVGQIALMKDLTPQELNEMNFEAKGFSGATNFTNLSNIKSRRLQLVAQSERARMRDEFMQTSVARGMDRTQASDLFNRMIRRSDAGPTSSFLTPEESQMVSEQEYNQFTSGSLSNRIKTRLSGAEDPVSKLMPSLYALANRGASWSGDMAEAQAFNEKIKTGRLSKKDRETAKSSINEFFTKGVEGLMMTGLSMDAAQAGMAERMIGAGFSDATVRHLSSATIENRSQRYFDASRSKMVEALNEITSRGATATKGLTFDQYGEIMDKYKGILPAHEIAMKTSDGTKMVPLSAENITKIKKGESIEVAGESFKAKDLREQAEKELKTMDTFEYQKQMEYALSEESQPVKITNSSDVGTAVGNYLVKLGVIQPTRGGDSTSRGGG